MKPVFLILMHWQGRQSRVPSMVVMMMTKYYDRDWQEFILAVFLVLSYPFSSDMGDVITDTQLTGCTVIFVRGLQKYLKEL